MRDNIYEIKEAKSAVDNLMNAFAEPIYSIYSFIWGVMAGINLLRGNVSTVLIVGCASIGWSILILWARCRKWRLDAFEALEELGE